MASELTAQLRALHLCTDGSLPVSLRVSLVLTAANSERHRPLAAGQRFPGPGIRPAGGPQRSGRRGPYGARQPLPIDAAEDQYLRVWADEGAGLRGTDSDASQGCGSATRFRDCSTQKKIKRTCFQLVTWRPIAEPPPE